MSHLKSLSVALCMIAAVPGSAFAHAELIKSEPAADGTLAAGAKEILFTYDEEIQPATCKLTTPDGKDVANLGKPHAEGVVLHIPIAKMLPAGRYSVACRVVGPDSHPINSSVSFVLSDAK